MNLGESGEDEDDGKQVLSHKSGGESREKSLLRLGAHPPSWGACCPIDFQQVEKMDSVPDDTSNHGEKPGETVVPRAEKSLKAQQDIEQQGDPDLPAHGVGGVARGWWRRSSAGAFYRALPS